MPRNEEARLLALAQSGDQAAFSALVHDVKDRLWSVCLGITRDYHDSQDVLQEAIVVAWQNIGSFRGEARFGTWIHQIAKNAAYKLLDRRREYPGDDVGNEEVSPTTDIGDRVADGDAVLSALGQLKPDFREAIVLREWGGLTYAEIASRQGVSIQTVKSRLNRARTTLRGLLAPA